MKSLLSAMPMLSVQGAETSSPSRIFLSAAFVFTMT
nr:MAG TPA: hypothetical protein [Caudoviricetes sp.]